MNMERLDTIVSVVSDYTDSLSSSYIQLTGDTESVRAEVRSMQDSVRAAEQTVSGQVYKARNLEDEARSKRNMYEGMRMNAEAEVRAAQAQVDYVLNNPIPVTETDEDGNSHTHYEIDQAALAAAERELGSAQSEYAYYAAKCADAADIEADASAAVQRFEAMHKAIQNVEQHIGEQLLHIERLQQDVHVEAEYNLTCMRKVCERMTSYLSCKPIYRA